jgi:hypothetical protein
MKHIFSKWTLSLSVLAFVLLLGACSRNTFLSGDNESLGYAPAISKPANNRQAGGENVNRALPAPVRSFDAALPSLPDSSKKDTLKPKKTSGFKLGEMLGFPSDSVKKQDTAHIDPDLKKGGLYLKYSGILFLCGSLVSLISPFGAVTLLGSVFFIPLSLFCVLKWLSKM